MKVWGYVVVAASFVATALIAYAIIRAVKPDSPDLALVVAAIVATQVGVVLWQRQDAKAPLLRVKLGLGALLSGTAVLFTLAMQAVASWLPYPEVTTPIAAVGCFVFPFALVGPLWQALSKNRPPRDGPV
jgi:hypothetical protein